MNLRALLVAGLAGLAAGIAAGLLIPRGGGAATPTAFSPAQPSAQRANGATAQAGQHAASGSYDERFSHVFSALQQRVRLRQRLELFEALRDLTAADMPGLMKHAATLPKDLASDLTGALLERWFALDPAAARTWALAENPMEIETMNVWARADPEGAIRAALSAPTEWWDHSLLIGALDTLYGKDSAAMMARARTLPPGELRDYALAVGLQQWATRDPAAAWAALAEIPPGPAREDARDSLLRGSVERDPAWTLARLGEILPTLKASVLGNDLVTRIAEEIAAKNPRLALDWLSAIPAEFRATPAIAAAREWTKKEPLAALEWCVANGVDLAQANYMDTSGSMWQPAVLGGAMESAPEETFAWLAARPAGADRDRLLECAFMESLWHTPEKQLFADDAAMAWRFYDALPPDAQVAKAWLFAQKRAAKTGVSDLAAWAQDFPPGLARSNAIAGAISAAQQLDAAPAEAFLATVSPGPDRDAALRGFADAQRQSAPTAAAERALGIGDATVRRDTLEAVVLPWLQSDVKTSRAWLQSAAAIPAEWKQEWLRSPIPPR